MNSDMITIIIALAALAALASPVLTALINNKHLRKMREIEFKEKSQDSYNMHKRELLEHFLICISDATAGVEPTDAKLNASFYKIIPYIPDTKLDRFIQIVKDINRNENSEFWFSDITKDILPVIRELLSELPQHK